VRLAGHLSEAQVPDLLAACSVSGETRIAELDELVSADAVGVDALLRIERDGVTLVALPEYLRFELDELARTQGH
jgi:hypothetical protein